MRAKVKGECGSLSRTFHSGCPGARRINLTLPGGCPPLPDIEASLRSGFFASYVRRNGACIVLQKHLSTKDTKSTKGKTSEFGLQFPFIPHCNTAHLTMNPALPATEEDFSWT